MEQHDLDKVIQALQQVTKETVNGKIDNMSKKLDEYITHDMAWKETVQPVVDAYTTVNRFGIFMVWLSRILLAIVAILGIKHLF